ncbi:MAG: S41 family peptidase, partial [Bacteroidota bacterium]
SGEPVVYEGSWNEAQYIDPQDQPLLTVAALQSDFALIEQVVRQVHPGTFRYLTEAELTAKLAQLKTQFNQPLSIGDAYLALNELLASIRCGHTGSPMYNQGPVVTSMLHYGKDKLPFTFRWMAEGMVVMQDATEDRVVPEGSVVTEINGVPAAEVLVTLRKYVGSDGPATGPVDAMLSLRGYAWRLEAFDALYHLAFPLPQTGFRLKLQTPEDDAPVEVTVPAVRRKERAAILTKRYPEHPQRADDLWRLDFEGEHTAILTVGDFTGFGLGKLALDYKEFFAEAFAEIDQRGVERLIIDVRENEGGNDPIVLELFTYLQYDKGKGSPFEGRMRYQSFPKSLRPYVKTWGDNIPAFFDPKPGKQGADGYYVYPKAFTDRHPKRKKNAFGGAVVFLISPLNASLGFYLANNVRRGKVGALIGRTTGGCLRGINGGNLALLRLPQTNLELDFPVLGGFARTPQPATGVAPDVEVQSTLADIRQGRDPVLAAARQFLAGIE